MTIFLFLINTSGGSSNGYAWEWKKRGLGKASATSSGMSSNIGTGVTDLISSSGPDCRRKCIIFATQCDPETEIHKLWINKLLYSVKCAFLLSPNFFDRMYNRHDVFIVMLLYHKQTNKRFIQRLGCWISNLFLIFITSWMRFVFCGHLAIKIHLSALCYRDLLNRNMKKCDWIHQHRTSPEETEYPTILCQCID